MDQKLIFKIGLTLIPKIGPVTAKSLIAHCGSAEAVFSESKKGLEAIPGVGKALARNILSQNVLKIAEKEIFKIENFSIIPIFYLDNKYPSRLKHYNDSPLMIYCKGNADLNAARMVSIVGTRNPSDRGTEFCHELISSLECYGVSIVSGLAYGIDIAAHKASLKYNLPTVGVMGNGLGTVYPGLHRPVARKMVENGALISEFLFDVLPERVNFPMRNRIIAALCDALVVVETARKGGSMITAEMANSYHKDVFAVPGRLYDAQSAGCNHKLSAEGASFSAVFSLAEGSFWQVLYAQPKMIIKRMSNTVDSVFPSRPDPDFFAPILTTFV